MISRAIAELLHERSIEEFGGAKGIRDEGGVEAALARPYQTFGGEDSLSNSSSEGWCTHGKHHHQAPMDGRQ